MSQYQGGKKYKSSNRFLQVHIDFLNFCLVILGILIFYNLESIRSFLNKNLNINIFPPDIVFNRITITYKLQFSIINCSAIYYYSTSIFFPALAPLKLDPVKNLKMTDNFLELKNVSKKFTDKHENDKRRKCLKQS